MSNHLGQFVWFELMTTDVAAATAFYGHVVGWSSADSGMPGMAYTILSAQTAMVGGVMELPQNARDAGRRPGWLGYIAATDVDAFAARAAAAGGTVHRGPDDIPGVGRFAVVADPQGAVFVLFKSAMAEQAPTIARDKIGHVGWHELHASDHAAALPFYADLFGWAAGDAIDMGPMGTNQIFTQGGTMLGGMMTAPVSSPVRGWLYYINVDEIGAAIGRVENAGGTVTNGPHQVPGGSWIGQCVDPQGAMFALVSASRT
jgi:predicted enzyme related to lactoylglutathione lyase